MNRPRDFRDFGDHGAEITGSVLLIIFPLFLLQITNKFVSL